MNHDIAGLEIAVHEILITALQKINDQQIIRLMRHIQDVFVDKLIRIIVNTRRSMCWNLLVFNLKEWVE